MSRPRSAIALACLCLLGAAEQVVVAETLEEVLRTCAAEANDSLRLACYDRTVGSRLKPTVAAAASRSGAAPTPAAAPSDPAAASAAGASETTARGTTASGPGVAPAGPGASDFGVRNGPLDQRRYAAPAGPSEISAAVTRIEERSGGLLVFSLDNGQSWIQNEPSGNFPLKVGDTVRIRAGALGSYMLLAPSKRFTHVTRIR